MNEQLRKLFLRCRDYKSLFVVSILSNIMVALATLLTIPIMKPLLSILFEPEQNSVSPIPPSDNNGALFNVFQLKESITYSFYSWFGALELSRQLLFACSFIVVVFFFKNVFQYIANVAQAMLRNHLGRDLRNDMMQKLLKLPVSSVQVDKKGDIITRFSADIKMVEDGFFGLIETIFKSPLIILGVIIIMIVLSPQLTLFVLVLMVFTIFVIGGVSRALRRQSQEAQKRFGDLISILEESIGGLKTIKAYFAQQYIFQFFRKNNQSYIDTVLRILRRRDLSSPLSEFLGILVVTVLLWYGTKLVFSGQMTSSTFLTFIFAFYNVIDPSKRFSSAAYRMQEAIGAYDRIDEFLLRTDESEAYRFGSIVKNDLTQHIIVRDLSFRYPNSDRLVLQNINLTIPRGSKIALVGQSGSGKSTLADLMCRFLIPTSGEIRFDDTPLQDIEEESLRRMLTLVQQDTILFNDSVRENVIFGYAQGDDKRLEKALRDAHALEFVDRMTQGADTNIGDGGGLLSGGQQQRLNIARALLRDSPILILDEATSALDGATEQKVQNAIKAVTTGRTSIIIAHRLTTVQDADCIYVMDEGRIVEQGSHSELIREGGLYEKFVKLQQLL